MTEQQATETIELPDVPDDVTNLLPEDPAPYRTLLEVWRAVLAPADAADMRDDPISPQWATKMVTTYPGITFGAVRAVHHGVFDKAADMARILDEEIATDDECLKKSTAEEDAAENSAHYRNMLAGWQVYLLQEELAWNPDDEDAAVELAILSEVQQMFLGQTGLVAHLDAIGFQFTEDDQADLQQKLTDARSEALGEWERGDDE